MTGSGRKPPWPKSLLVAGVFFGYNAFVTHLPFYFLRHFYLRSVLRMRIGKGASVHMGCFFTGRHVSIGPRSVINRRCYLDGRAGLAIGADVSVSPECCLLSLTHDVNDPDFAAVPKPITIGDRAWLGMRALVLPGASLGEGSVAAAGAVVTKPVAPFAIVAGSPAKPIGERSRDLRYSLDYFPILGTDVQL